MSYRFQGIVELIDKGHTRGNIHSGNDVIGNVVQVFYQGAKAVPMGAYENFLP